MRNWYGSVEKSWKNEETGQVIEFKHIDGGVDVWLYDSSDTVRGQRMGKASNLSEAIEKAKEIAMEYDEECWELYGAE